MKLVIGILAIILFVNIGYSQDRHFLGSQIYPAYGDLLPLNQKFFARGALTFFSEKGDLRHAFSLRGPNWIEKDFWTVPRMGIVVDTRNIPEKTIWYGLSGEFINSRALCGSYIGTKYKNYDFKLRYLFGRYKPFRGGNIGFYVRFNF
ncbi:MAG: hypothetical protein QMD65_01235 [Patescibacteria group bacterium]|nr:hypothetical protein [Patescibacteria group bacterium]